MEGAHEKPEPVGVETLLEEGAWVSRLARRLVLDTETADDVVQDTWLAALRHGPFESGRMRPWLARVVQNFSRHEKRSRRHRHEREEASARPEAEPSALETAERLETQRRLVEALAEISEPFRTVLMRRYYDGLSAVEIAEQDGIPASTVRWRLMRGVEELRAKLDRRFGDRRAWGLALIPLATSRGAPHVAALGSATWTGVLVMDALTRTAIAAALVITASIGVFYATRTATPLEPAAALAPTSLAEAEKSESAKKPGSEIAAAEPIVERTVAPTTKETKPQAAVAEKARTHTRIQGRFVDVDGHAIEGVTITTPLALDRSQVRSDDHGRFDFETDTYTVSGSKLVLDATRVVDADFFAERAGFASHFARLRLESSGTSQAGDIVLKHGGSVAGHVIGIDGKAIAGARVVVLTPDLTSEIDSMRRFGPAVFPGAPETKSDARGRFEIAGVQARGMRAWAGLEGMRWAMSKPFDVPLHGVSNEVVLTLEPLADEDRVEGVVQDPEGHPIPKSVVNYRYQTLSTSGLSSLQADEHGHFKILVPAKVPLDLEVNDPKNRWPAISAKSIVPGTLDCVLRFKEARRIDLVFEDEHGGPVTKSAFSAASVDQRRMLTSDDEKERANGHAVFAVPGESFTLDAWADGRARVHLGPFDPEALPARIVVTLESLPGLRGTVLAGESAVRGAKLTLYTTVASGSRVDHNGYLTRLDERDSETATSDAKGRFTLNARKSGSFVILCESAGYALAEIGVDDVDPKKGRDDLVIHVGRGGTIEGHVVAPKGRDAGGILVGINRFDGLPRDQRTDSTGKFRFENLTPGGWQVQRMSSALDSHSNSTRWISGVPEVKYRTNCVVIEGQTTRFDLDLSGEFDARLVGHLTINRAPAVGWSVAARPMDVNMFMSAPPGDAVDVRGNFLIHLPRPTSYSIEVRQVVDDGTALSLSLARELEVHADDNPWALDLRCGAIEGRIPAGDAMRTLVVSWSEVQGMRGECNVALDAEGRFKIPAAPVGTLQLELRRGGDSATEQVIGKRDAVVVENAITTVEW